MLISYFIEFFWITEKVESKSLISVFIIVGISGFVPRGIFNSLLRVVAYVCFKFIFWPYNGGWKLHEVRYFNLLFWYKLLGSGKISSAGFITILSTVIQTIKAGQEFMHVIYYVELIVENQLTFKVIWV